MISGAARADAAVLVVPAQPNEFEAGFSAQGQTKEHAILARSLGVNQVRLRRFLRVHHYFTLSCCCL
jgi:translation elongation factor EF-1alpha